MSTELRTYQVGQVQAQLRYLRLSDNLETFIEATPYLHRRHLLGGLEDESREPGMHVHDLDRIRADVAAQVKDWLPRMRVDARLTAWWTPDDATEDGHTQLSVVWFQDGSDDPFTRLATILAPLDWPSLATFHEDSY